MFDLCFASVFSLYHFHFLGNFHMRGCCTIMKMKRANFRRKSRQIMYICCPPPSMIVFFLSFLLSSSCFIIGIATCKNLQVILEATHAPMSLIYSEKFKEISRLGCPDIFMPFSRSHSCVWVAIVENVANDFKTWTMFSNYTISILDIKNEAAVTGLA